jgi:hypothetical protein
MLHRAQWVREPWRPREFAGRYTNTGEAGMELAVAGTGLGIIGLIVVILIIILIVRVL